MNNCEIKHTLDDENHIRYSEMNGTEEEILSGFAHMIATFLFESWGSNPDVDIREIWMNISEYLHEAIPVFLEQFQEESSELLQ